MVNVLTLTAFTGLVTLVSSYNTHRQDIGDVLEDFEKSRNKVYIYFEDFVTENPSASVRGVTPTDNSNGSISDPDPLSVVWYLGAFGGLIAFFLVVTFSEWCCASKHLYRRHALATPYLAGYSTESRAPDTPPPPYHLFAPPPYAEATCCDKQTTPAPIFIIPVHQAPLQSPPAPPPAPPTEMTLPTQA